MTPPAARRAVPRTVPTLRGFATPACDQPGK
jgi:hypothetical protein